VKTGAGQIFNLPRTDDFSRRGKVPSHLTAKVVSTVAFQNKIKNLSCTRENCGSENKISQKTSVKKERKKASCRKEISVLLFYCSIVIMFFALQKTHSNHKTMKQLNNEAITQKKNLCHCRGSNKKQKTNYKPTMKTQICV